MLIRSWDIKKVTKLSYRRIHLWDTRFKLGALRPRANRRSFTPLAAFTIIVCAKLVHVTTPQKLTWLASQIDQSLLEKCRRLGKQSASAVLVTDLVREIHVVSELRRSTITLFGGTMIAIPLKPVLANLIDVQRPN